MASESGVQKLKRSLPWLLIVIGIVLLVNWNTSRMQVQTTGLGGAKTQDTIASKGYAQFQAGGSVTTAAAQQGSNQCVSTFKTDTPTAQCQAFCNLKHKKFHCLWCKCRACEFCPKGGDAIEEAARTAPPPFSPPPPLPAAPPPAPDDLNPAARDSASAEPAMSAPAEDAATPAASDANATTTAASATAAVTPVVGSAMPPASANQTASVTAGVDADPTPMRQETNVSVATGQLQSGSAPSSVGASASAATVATPASESAAPVTTVSTPDEALEQQDDAEVVAVDGIGQPADEEAEEPQEADDDQAEPVGDDTAGGDADEAIPAEA